MKNLKTSEIVTAYQLIKTAQMSGMTLDEKKAVLSATRALKAVATDFEDFRADAMERLKGDNHDKMVEALTNWQQQERDGNVTLTESERKEIEQYFSAYNSEVVACLQDEADKAHDVDLKPVNFDKLLDANNWTLEQCLLLEDTFC